MTSGSLSLRRPGRPHVARARRRGLTLVELMTVLAVMAVLISVGVPSFQLIQNVGRLSGPTNEFLGALQLARMEAVRRGQRVVLCNSSNGTSCAGSATQWSGWLIFVDSNTNGAVDTGEDIIRVGTFAGPATVQSSPAVRAAVAFRPDGLARGTGQALLEGQFRVCLPTRRPAENARAVTIASGGRIATRQDNLNGACPVPTSNT